MIAERRTFSGNVVEIVTREGGKKKGKYVE
jgi:hypothetical protein